MTTYARIQNGVVAELFTPPAGIAITDCFHASLTWVAATSGVEPGWTWNGTHFAAPPPTAPPANPVTIGAYAYFQRFTATETAAIHTAALVSPPTSASLQLFNYLMLASAAGSVTLTDAAVVAGHAALVAMGLLTTARSAAILTP